MDTREDAPEVAVIHAREASEAAAADLMATVSGRRQRVLRPWFRIREVMTGL